MTPHLRDQLIEKLEAENDQLRERVTELERLLQGTEIATPIEWALTTSEELVFGAMVSRERVSKDFLLSVLYRGLGQDEAEPKIVDVFVCKMRKKLAPFGIVINTLWGRGYALDPATRKRFQQQPKVAA